MWWRKKKYYSKCCKKHYMNFLMLNIFCGTLIGAITTRTNSRILVWKVINYSHNNSECSKKSRIIMSITGEVRCYTLHTGLCYNWTGYFNSLTKLDRFLASGLCCHYIYIFVVLFENPICRTCFEMKKLFMFLLIWQVMHMLGRMFFISYRQPAVNKVMLIKRVWCNKWIVFG